MHVLPLWPVLLMVTYVGANYSVLPSTSGTGQTSDSPQPPCYYPQQSCNYDYSNSQETGLTECRDPTYDVCFIPRSNALQYKPYPLTIKQGAYDTAFFVSWVEITPLTRFWDGVCYTHIKLTSILYIQIRTVTLNDGTYNVFPHLITDEVASPGNFVASRTTQTDFSRIEHSTITGNTTISQYSFRGIYTIGTYGQCYKVHFYPNYLDLTTTYPPLIPASVRSQAASQLLGNVPKKRPLAYENNAYCITSMNGINVLNPQTSKPAIGVSLPQN